MSSTKNNFAWTRLFKKYRIPEKIEGHGVFEISAKQINEFREARLMTKFDHKKNLSMIFKRHGLSILPVTRGIYLISQLLFSVYLLCYFGIALFIIPLTDSYALYSNSFFDFNF